MTKTYKRPTGFTLMELLIVMAIIIVLFALLFPMISTQRKRMNDRQAQTEIAMIRSQLEDYFTEHRVYPTTEQGLYALYYRPDNYGITSQSGAGLSQPGIPGASDGYNGYTSSGTGQGMGGMSEMPGGGMNPGGMNPGGMNSGGMNPGGMNPGGMNPGGMNPGGMNPSGMNPGGMNPGGMASGTFDGSGGMGMGGNMGTASTWTQPTHNPQLYTGQHKLPSPYLELKQMNDPWGRPYRYDNTINMQYGVNQYTGTPYPAVWSAGYDGKDNTDDDIRGWNPNEAANEFDRLQRQVQNNGNGTGQGMGGMSDMPGGGMPGGGMPGGGMPGGGMPGGGMPGGGMPGGGMPGGGMPGGGMPGGGMPGGGMPGGGMPGGGTQPQF